MTEAKLSCDEVPEKFTEWLLAIGCPPEKVPSIEKVTEICRGQYYMVWRSLIEHVEAKDVIRQKRLQVFCDDVRKWKRKNRYKYQQDTTAVMPDELTLWQQHHDIKDKVDEAEAKIQQAQHNLKQLMDKISTKLTHRDLSRRRVQDIQRRAWLLQRVAAELRAKKDNLEETRSIAGSLCLVDEDVDVQGKLEQFLSSLRRTPAHTSLLANPVACSSVVSANGDGCDAESQLSWLTKCRGDTLWPQLCERRAGLVNSLTSANGRPAGVGVSPQCVLAHTAALHCSLALEALKKRAHIKQTRKRLADAVSELNSYLTGEACELLVLRCEQARGEARGHALRDLAAEVTSRTGLFKAGGPEAAERAVTGRQIAAMDKAIESKKEELKKLVTSLAATEKKIHNVRECLAAIFRGFLNHLPEQDRYKGQVNMPQESIAVLRQFYDDRRSARRDRMQLSMDLDVSDSCSLTESTGNSGSKFADELKVYLKNFNLEKNRKLVLESGEKIWIFESLQAAISRLHGKWLDSQQSCALVCPSVRLSCNLETVINLVQKRREMETVQHEVENGTMKPNLVIDLSIKSKEDEILDKIKKRLNENLINLQKTNKTLDGGNENIKFWADNEMRNHISLERCIDIDGRKTYKDYEADLLPYGDYSFKCKMPKQGFQ